MSETLLHPLTSGRVLVAGLIPGNLPSDITNDDRVIIWSTEEAGRKQALPDDVAVVLVTRFVRHDTTNRLKAFARKQGARFETRLYTLGMLRESLRILLGVSPARPVEAIIEAPEPDAAPLAASMRSQFAAIVPAAEHGPTYRTMADFIRAHLPETPTKPLTSYAEEFEPQLRAHGFTPTRGSLLHALSDVKQERLRDTSPPATHEPPPPAVVEEAPRRSVPAETRAPDTSPRPTPTPSAAHAELLRMIDDMIAAAHLIRDRMVQLETDNAALVARHKRLKAALAEEEV